MFNQISSFIRSTLLPNRLFLINGNKTSKSIYLTFDDGPVASITEKLLNLLYKHNALATFFIIGSRGSQSAELLKKIHQQKHTLANHSYTHPNFTLLSGKDMREQITKTNQLIEKITRQHCQFFRAPQGRWNFKLFIELFRLKITAVHWSRDSMDYLKQPAEKIISHFIEQPVTSGDIILFHDDDPRCIKALETLIPHWQSQGFTLQALEHQ